MFENIFFANKWAFFLLLIIPFLIYRYIKKNKKEEPAINYSSIELFNLTRTSIAERLKHLPFILRMIAIILLIVAFARPQSYLEGENIFSEGIDIALVVDISGSMLAEDFKPNRIEASKKVVDNFIQDRVADRIGLVIFSREAFTQCPLTIDYTVLRNLLKEVKSGMIEDGTAIGNAIANGINRLKNSKAKSKVIILLTDGMNNAGEVDPLSAAYIAQSYGIKIYTIGVGTMGQAPYPIRTPFGTQYQMVPVEIDEKLLKEIATLTNGKYYRATGNARLQAVYDEIDKLEKSKIEVTSYRKASELFYCWLEAAIILLLLEVILRSTVLRKIP
ncbi:MAG TPA: VWA domain-containing protein [Ignavibacteriaceae bacterium]|nr:VWA domain-containing protein [Ignavibacteriaceae bacterium]